jgi:carboxyl-terminal processing protease
MELNEEQAKRFDRLSEYQSDLSFESLPYEIKMFEVDTVLSEKRERWHENLKSDIYMEEAVHVLEDMKMNNIKKSGLADVKK